MFYSDKSTFLAGADIHGMYPLLDERVAVDVARNGQRLFDRINAIKVPTVAAINVCKSFAVLFACLWYTICIISYRIVSIKSMQKNVVTTYTPIMTIGKRIGRRT